MRVATEMGSELEFGNIPEMDYGVVVGVGGHTECLRDGICLESESEVAKGVPLQ